MEDKRFYIENGKTMVFKVVDDEYPVNPREEFDNLGTMLCWHRRYRLGDKNPYEIPYDFFEERLGEDVRETIQESMAALEAEGYTFLPLYLFDHSGLSISTSDYGDKWDSGQIGFVYTTPERIAHMGTPQERVKDCLKEEVEEYDLYLRGECYGYQISDRYGNVVDSCYGFLTDAYGDDLIKEICPEAGIKFEDLLEEEPDETQQEHFEELSNKMEDLSDTDKKFVLWTLLGEYEKEIEKKRVPYEQIKDKHELAAQTLNDSVLKGIKDTRETLYYDIF